MAELNVKQAKKREVGVAVASTLANGLVPVGGGLTAQEEVVRNGA